MRYRSLAIALVVLPLMPHDACAQGGGSQSSVPEPIVQMTIDPPRVVVGQKTMLRVEVLAPNYMTAPPELPDFQVRNAVTRQLQSVNRSEERNGTNYAGVQFEFAIYPQEPGSYAIADQTLKVSYAAEPPAAKQAVIALPRIEFQAFIPDAAATLSPFLAASKLTIAQAIQRSSDQLKTGDAVTRIITVTAEGTPAMLLPLVTFPAIDGLALYPAQPSLQDSTDSRTDVLSSTRVDSATYMLERPGDYRLPAIDVRWWNSAAQKIELAHVDGVALQVAANPAAAGAASAGEPVARWNWDAVLDLIADHWLLAVLVLAALAALGWFTPRAARAISARYRQRREAYLRSETFAFDHLRRAARGRDAKTVYFALLEWLQRFEPVAPLHTVRAFTNAAQDPALDHEIGAIEQELFAPDRGARDWSPRQLLHRVGIARRGLRPHGARAGKTPLPQQLNPTGGDTAPAYRQRMPAR